mgnify:CR=1 FL=1
MYLILCAYDTILQWSWKIDFSEGKERTFTSASGNTVTVSGGNYGWKIDQNAEYNALIANIQNAETVTREPNYSSRAASHEGNDVGNTYAEVNLTTQHMYYVKDGQIALETDVVTGNPNKGTLHPASARGLCSLRPNRQEEPSFRCKMRNCPLRQA